MQPSSSMDSRLAKVGKPNRHQSRHPHPPPNSGFLICTAIRAMPPLPAGHRASASSRMPAVPARPAQLHGRPSASTCLLATHDCCPVPSILLDAQVHPVEDLRAAIRDGIHNAIRHGVQLWRELEALGYLCHHRQVAARGAQEAQGCAPSAVPRGAGQGRAGQAGR